MVFPAGTEIHPDGKTGPVETRFWLIPGKEGEPRWILPHEPKLAWPFLRQWSPHDSCSRFKWLCLMAAYRGGRLGWVPGVIPLQVVTSESESWNHLGWRTTPPPVPVIYVGTPGPARKAVFGLTDPRTGAVSSVGKVPLGPAAAVAIRREADILEKLAREKPGRAPRMLFVNHSKGIATQEFVDGLPTERQLTERHVACLSALTILGETISLREVLSDLRRQLDGSGHLAQNAHAVLERVLDEADDPSPLPAVWEHGDFAPWNLIKMPDGSLRAVDWEAAARRGLPLFDLVYFRSIQMMLFGEKKLFSKSSRALLHRYLVQLDISPAKTGKIVRACLARDWLRCHETGEVSRATFLLRTMATPIGELL